MRVHKLRPVFSNMAEKLDSDTVQTDSRSSAESRGGYDCEFVEPPPEAIQSECPVCLLILKEPCLISCCGHKFCRICVERVKENEKPCPLCSEPDFSFMRERGLERFLNGVQVLCSYKKDGCEWKGKLGELKLHLNRTLSPENRLNGCQFVEVECTLKCGEWFQRHHITSHETKQCKKRPYSCDYCQDYQSTFEDVTEIHYLQCSKYPVACPNECREDMFERRELESHLRDQCPLTLVDCPFHYAGCQTQLPRKDMPEHMRETVTHLTLLASVTQNLVKENQELRQKVEEEVKTLKEKVHELELQHAVFFYVEQTNDDVYLPAFYTHQNGYRMCVHIYPNGCGDGEGTHVSIFIHMMQGPFDDHLKWPFRGEITIQIVNQAGDHDHIEETIPYDDKTPDKSTGRVTGKERDDCGWGFHQFLAHTALPYNAVKKTQYLKDNHLIVRVVHVKLDV